MIHRLVLVINCLSHQLHKHSNRHAHQSHCNAHDELAVNALHDANSYEKNDDNDDKISRFILKRFTASLSGYG